MLDRIAEAVLADGVAELPPSAHRALAEAKAPPRLIAHRFLVHDLAVALTTKIVRHWPDAPLDGEAVAFGAA